MNLLRLSLVMSLLLGAALHAQELPDIERLEVKNYRVVFLDKGGRRAILEGARAHKRADGLIQVDDAKLTVGGGEGSFTLQSKRFDYSPKSSEFRAPEGLVAVLPDGGTLTLPPGTGELTLGNPLKLTVNTTGDAALSAGKGLLSANMKDPVVTMSLRSFEVPSDQPPATVTRFALQQLEVKSARGASLKVRLDSVPDLQGNPTQQADVSMSCFGDAALTLKEVRTDEKDAAPGNLRATLSMLRRAEMSIRGEKQQFEVTSEYIEMHGDVAPLAPGKKDDEAKDQPQAQLTNVELIARSNVHLSGEGLEGRGGELLFRRLASHTQMRLSMDPTMTLARGFDDDDNAMALSMRASASIEVFARNAEGDSGAQSAKVELLDDAKVTRLRGDTADWEVLGTQVRVFSWRDTPKTYSHSFDVVGRGFAPLLKVFESAVPGGGEAPEVVGATVTGSRAEGTLVGDRCDVRVAGPDTMAIVHSDFAMAEVIRSALGLRATRKPPRRDGRLVVNARDSMELGLVTARREVGDLRVAASGAVSLVHHPIPRDDADMVTLNGDLVAIEIQGGTLKSAGMQSSVNEGAVATIGYDLLLARNVQMRGGGDALSTDITGPGRVVARDAQSLQFFLDAINQLPRRDREEPDDPTPDAGWLEFGGDVRITNEQDEGETRVLEIEYPTAYLVHGDFENPRAGVNAVNDLAELLLPEVQRIYYLTARRAVLRSFKLPRAPDQGDEDSPTVNVLRLEGDAVVDSAMDEVRATASIAIELTGAQKRRDEDGPFTGVLLGRSELYLARAAEFFGRYVSTGVFSYNGTWILRADDRLELTMRPVDAAFPGGAIETVRKQLFEAGEEDNEGEPKIGLQQRLELAQAARDTLARLLGDVVTGAEDLPAELEQPRRALAEIELACAALSGVAPGHDEQAEAAAINNARVFLNRATSLLGALIDIAAAGGLQAEFNSRDERVPRMDLSLSELVVSFNGLGEAVALDAQGPIVLSREEYQLRGSRLSLGKDGAAQLDGASIKLPEETGVTVEGVRSVSLKPNAEQGVVTRISGVRMRVRIQLGSAKRQ